MKGAVQGAARIPDETGPQARCAGRDRPPPVHRNHPAARRRRPMVGRSPWLRFPFLPLTWRRERQAVERRVRTIAPRPTAWAHGAWRKWMMARLTAAPIRDGSPVDGGWFRGERKSRPRRNRGWRRWEDAAAHRDARRRDAKSARPVRRRAWRVRAPERSAWKRRNPSYLLPGRVHRARLLPTHHPRPADHDATWPIARSPTAQRSRPSAAGPSAPAAARRRAALR